MPQNVILYDILVSCPGDITEERKIIEEEIIRFNELYSDTLGISLRTRHWSKSSFPESGDKPQALLNKQFVYNCDAAIALFWGRFGTPTDKYESGTEEEIEIMLSQGKQVFMYFSDIPISPSKIDEEQYSRVKAFRDKYKDRGIYEVYTSIEEFRRKIFAHISAFFLTINKVSELTSKEMPKLGLKGLDENQKPTEMAKCRKFSHRIPLSSALLEESIKARIKSVDKMHLEANTTTSSFLALREKVSISKKTVLEIQQYSERKGIEISDSFFDLGNLSRDSVSLDINGYREYYGTTEEKSKHDEIINIRNMIRLQSALNEIEKQFAELNCVELVLVNTGRKIDEDIEVTITIPTEVLVIHSELPKLSDETIKEIMDTITAEALFEISKSVMVDAYSSCRHDFVMPKIGFINDEEIEQFYKRLDYLFDYEVFHESDDSFIKLNVPYLKHNCAIAFPTPIFIRNHIGEIPYRITSKHMPEAIEGVIEVD